MKKLAMRTLFYHLLPLIHVLFPICVYAVEPEGSALIELNVNNIDRYLKRCQLCYIYFYNRTDLNDGEWLHSEATEAGGILRDTKEKMAVQVVGGSFDVSQPLNARFDFDAIYPEMKQQHHDS